jgi:hypothetical protein
MLAVSAYISVSTAAPPPGLGASTKITAVSTHDQQQLAKRGLPDVYVAASLLISEDTKPSQTPITFVLLFLRSYLKTGAGFPHIVPHPKSHLHGTCHG